MTVALYATFTFCCFLSPTFTRYLGPIRALTLGICGYAILVIGSILFFIYPNSNFTKTILIATGAVNGVGASLLWNSQGLLILQYSERGVNGGKIFGIFWVFFSISAICGGLVSFLIFRRENQNGENNKNMYALFAIFLGFIILGALFTRALVPPSLLSRTNHDVTVNAIQDEGEDRSRIEEGGETFKETLRKDIKRTLSMFRSKRLLNLSLLFFYTGFKQPYQIVTFGDRFFDSSSLGLEVMIFYFFDMIGGIVTGALLDGKFLRSDGEKTKNYRKVSIQCILLFLTLTFVGNYFAWLREAPCESLRQDASNCLVEVRFLERGSILPTMSYALWGFTDSVVQTFCYWVMGLYYDSNSEQARAVGFYTFIQSVGWTLGFLIIPESRVIAIHQLYLTSLSIVAGVFFAWFELPQENTPTCIFQESERLPLLSNGFVEKDEL